MDSCQRIRGSEIVIVTLEIWGSVLGRYVLALGVFEWAWFILSFSVLVWKVPRVFRVLT